MQPAEAWEQLSLYESRDLVREFYKLRHGRELSSSKAKEIISHLTQGRQYFRSAEQAAELVAPLLLYYGVLSLTRGMILFCDQNKSSEATLSKAHGLEAVSWEQELTDISRLPAIQIRTTKGTFLELANVTKNVEEFHFTSTAHPEYLPILKQNGTASIPAGQILTLKDLLARIPELAHLYQQTFNEANETLHMTGAILDDDPTEEHDVDIRVYVDIHSGVSSGEILRQALGISHQPQSLEEEMEFDSFLDEHIAQVDDSETEVVQLQVSESSLADWPLVIRSRQNGSPAIVSQLPNDLRLSTLSLCFMVSYALGMLVRYYPSKWHSLTSGESGDQCLPLLRAAARLIAQRLPALILRELKQSRRSGLFFINSIRW